MSPTETVSAARHVLENCLALRLRGLMTIGGVENSQSKEGVNPDFQVRHHAARHG